MDRWEGIERLYSEEDVERLRGTVHVEHTLARLGAERLWKLLQEEDYVAALGALTGGQAVQAVKAGLKAIYLSGWQVAADANLAGEVYPDQSLYPATSAPALCRRINNALRRADRALLARQADRMPALVEARVASARASLQHAAAALDALDPLATLERGYAIVRTADGGIVMDARSRRAGDRLSVTLSKGALDVSVDGVRDSTP